MRWWDTGCNLLIWPGLRAVMATHPCWCRHCCQHSWTSQKPQLCSGKIKQQLHFLHYLCHSHFQSKRYCSLLLSKLISALLRENNLDSLPSSESQTVIATFSGGTGIIKSLRKDRVFLFVMKSKKEMKQVSLLVCRHGHQILIFKLSTYGVKSIKLLGQLSCNSKDTIFTVPLEENSAFILFLSLKHLIIILFYAY